MRSKDLERKRIIPALKELFENSYSIFQNEDNSFHVDFDKFIKVISDNFDRNSCIFSLYVFYLPEDKQSEIIEKYTKGFRSYWVWPYKSQIVYSDDDIAKMKKELEEIKSSTENHEYDFEYNILLNKIENNEINKKHESAWSEYKNKLDKLYEGLENKTLTRKEFNKQHANLAKEYGCRKRSKEKEAVRFEILSYSPSCSKESYDVYVELWKYFIEFKKNNHNRNECAQLACNKLFEKNDKNKSFLEDRYEQVLEESDLFITKYMQ